MTDTTKKLAATAALFLAGAFTASAGELSLAWSPSLDDVTGGYDVEVLDDSGQVIQTIDAKAETTARIAGLADGTTYRFRIRPYDQWGNRADTPSADVSTMPAPRVDMLSDWTVDGTSATAELLGANFAPGARVVAKRKGLAVTGATVVDQGRLTAQLKVAPGISPIAADFLVVNPVRRSEAYLAAHPELLDVDRNGRVDQADADAVARWFGAATAAARTSGTSGGGTSTAAGVGTPDSSTGATSVAPASGQPDFDVNGDGLIDGEDVAAILARVVEPRMTRSSRNTKDQADAR